MIRKLKHTIIILTILTIIFPFVNIFATDVPNISAKAAVVMDADSLVVLGGKNIDNKVYPASTTKILTAILAIENLDLSKSIVASSTALDIPWDSSSIYIKKGEILTVEELLYGLLLNSGNDAANVLAEGVSGSIDKFVDLMNEKLKELDCKNTQFRNAHGYSDDNHYTTPTDMAKVLSYCIQNETFEKIISTKEYVIKPTNKTNESRYLYNTNRLILTKEDSIYARFYKYCIGGKTGYTDEAGRTLVTYGKKDGKRVVVTVFGSDFINNVDTRYTDAINLFEYAFNNFNKVTVANKSNYNYRYVNLEKKLSYNLTLNDDLEILKSSDDNIDITSYDIKINDQTLENIDADSIIQDNMVGYITFNIINNSKNYSIQKNLKLVSVETLSIFETISILEIIGIILIILVILLVTIIILLLINKVLSKNAIKSRKDRRK